VSSPRRAAAPAEGPEFAGRFRVVAGVLRDAGEHHRVVLRGCDIEVLVAQLVGVTVVDDEPLGQIGAAGHGGVSTTHACQAAPGAAIGR
jgi:hypothetical protein